MAVLEIVSEYF